MEDIDNIIIHTLKHLNCPLEDDIQSLKQFDTDMVIKSLMSCIDVISPGTGLPHSLPPSMSQRLKLATNIADLIKDLGFRGDIGYQMILYGNEVEVRRLLMFLIERLPREPDKASHSEDSSHISSYTKAIRLKLNQSLKTIWVPSDVLRHGIRHSHGTTVRLSFGDCFPLKCTNLRIPDSSLNNSEELKQYYVHQLPDVTKQCSYQSLIPSLLFHSINAPEKLEQSHVIDVINRTRSYSKNWSETILEKPLVISEQQNKDEIPIENETDVSDPLTESVNILSTDIETVKSNIIALKDETKSFEVERLKALETKSKKEKELETSLHELKIKSKSHSLLSNKENIEKLKLVVDTGSQKLVELTNQWHSVQEPLLKRYRELLETVNVNEKETQELEERLQNAKQTYRKSQEELKEKDQLLTNLSEQCSKLSSQTNRSAYTRRILEIISNIKKQSNDIEKILNDTKEVQKEINTLNGQLERSFTLSDEVIFRDAKQEDTARKAYKLLVSVHTEYSEVIQATSELGSIIRETRNLQEQVDTEEAKEIGAKLERVMADLEQMRKETAIVMNQTTN